MTTDFDKLAEDLVEQVIFMQSFADGKQLIKSAFIAAHNQAVEECAKIFLFVDGEKQQQEALRKLKREG